MCMYVVYYVHVCTNCTCILCDYCIYIICMHPFLIRFEEWAKLAQKWLVCVRHWEYILSQLTKS